MKYNEGTIGTISTSRMGSATAILKAVPSPSLHRAALRRWGPSSTGFTALPTKLPGPPALHPLILQCLKPFAICKTRSLASLIGMQVNFTGYAHPCIFGFDNIRYFVWIVGIKYGELEWLFVPVVFMFMIFVWRTKFGSRGNNDRRDGNNFE